MKTQQEGSEDTKIESEDKTEEEFSATKFSIYDDECYFIAPHFILCPAPIRVLTLKFSLERFLKQNTNLNTMIAALINRENNKRVLLQLV